MKVYSDKDGSWYAEYSGGRLADVYHATKDGALDCFQVGAYDWEHGKLAEKITRDKVRRRLNEWVTEQGECFAAELPYL